MKELDLLLNILNKANLATPAIIGIISIIRSGRKQGKSDDEIQEESMALALETRVLAEHDKGDQA